MLRRLFKKHCVRHPNHQGFTLIEVLVSLLMAGLIISGLMGLVVDLLRTDQRELVLERTQQDMKRGLDYVADDLREAVYVYSDPATITTLVTDLSNTAHPLPGDAQPVLAFWKVRTLEDSDPTDTDLEDYAKLTTAAGANNCASLPAGDQRNNCNALLVRHGYYELVIYYSTEDNGDGLWSGQARVFRFSIPEYDEDALTGPDQLLIDPVLADNSPAPEFEDWTPVTGAAGAPDPDDSDALVDFVAALADGPAPACASADYTPTPSTTTTNAAGNPVVSNSFYACVRPINRDLGLLNQDVRIFLKGDADPADDSLALGGVSEASQIPILETQVGVRGVIDKDLR